MTIDDLEKKYGVNGNAKPTITNIHKQGNNSKMTIDDLEKKYGVNGNTKQTTIPKSNDGKQSKSSAISIDDLEKKYGVNGKTKIKSININNQSGSYVPSSPLSSLLEKGRSVATNYAQKSKYGVETNNAYTNTKDKMANKTTISNGMSDDERKSRIKEIEKEIQNINFQIQGLGRASSYGGSKDYYTSKSGELKKRKDELSKELTSLKREGTHTGSDMVQFEIDDLKAEKAKLPPANPTGRVMPEQVETHKANVMKHAELDEQIETLEREKDLYGNISKYEDVVNKDTFTGQWRANYRSNALSREADKAMAEYLKNPTEENKQIAYAYDAFAREYMKNNEDALDDENVKWGWLTKDIAGYLPQFKDQIVPEAIGYGLGLLFTGGSTAGGAAGAALGTYSQSYDVIRGSVYRTLLAEGIDEETAKQAAEDEALVSSLIESGETAIGLLIGGGGKAWSAITGAAKTSVAKGSTSAATKFLANMATKSTTKAATKAATGVVAQPLWKTGANIVFDLGKQGISEYGEEFLQQGVSIANRDRLVNNTGDNLLGATGKLIKDVATGKRPDALSEMHEAGTTGFKVGVMMGGSRTTVNNIITHYANAKTVKAQNEFVDALINDDESLDALVKEGKASGEGTVSSKIATEVEQARAEGSVTREQVKKLIVSNDVYIKEEERIAKATTPKQTTSETAKASSTPLHERLNALSQNNETIDIEDVKKATGFGDNGSKLVATLANSEGVTFSQAERMVKNAYMAGLTNAEGKTANFATDTQIDAFTAGKQDRVMQELADKANAEDAVVNKKAGFVAKNLPSDVTQSQVELIDLMSKGLGYKTFVTKGLKGNAEIDHSTGEVAIDFDFEREVGPVNNRQKVSIVYHAAHEIALHAVIKLAPVEGRAFVYAMYRHLAGDESSLVSTLADEKRRDYAKQGVELSLADAMEEISANNILYLYGNDETKLQNAMDKIINGNDTKAKQGLQKYLEILNEIIRKIKNFIAGKKGKDRAELQAELDEVTKLRDMFESAVAKAVQNTRTAQSQKAQKNTDTKSDSKNFSLKEIFDENGKSYGIGVVLDSDLLDNLTPEERVEMVKEYVKELGGKTFTAYDNNGKSVDIRIAKSNERFKNRNGKKVPVNRDLTSYLGNNKTKQEAITLVDELVISAKHSNSEPAKYSHGWLDNDGKNDWDYWTTYIQDKNKTIWEARLNIANSSNGEKILYDIYPIIEIAGQSVTSDTSTANNKVPQNPKSVKRDFSLKNSFSTDGMTDNEIENAQNVISNLKTYALSSKYLDGFASYTTERIVRELYNSSNKSIDYATSYVTWVNPIDFIYATTASEEKRAILAEEAGELDVERLAKEIQPIYLRVDFETGEIIGHEGRHRMLALQKSGIEKVAVVIEAENNDRYNTKPIDFMSLKGQRYTVYQKGTDMYISNVLPLSQRYADTARELFTTKPKSGIQFSLKDSKGNNLTEGQQEYFKDSKVVDENGNLLVMYQGSANDFTVFDRKKSKYSNLYGRGFYFTKSERHASQYGNTRAYYLNIKHPVSTTETTITKPQLRKFLEAVMENEDYSFENYGYDATIDSVVDSTYGKSDFLMLNDVSQTAIGDLVEAIELFNEINGTDYDGIILETETVTFNSEQAKLTTNENPTSNPDINFSLKKPVEETKDLIAVHNLWEEKLLKSLNLGGLPMPSIAIVKAQEGHNNFGNISLVFRKETINPTDRRNKVYSGDGYTPTYPHIEYKLNEAEQSKIEKKIATLVPKDIQKALGGLYLDSYNMEHTLNRSSDLISSYINNYAMKYAFLRDSGIELELPMKNARLSSGSKRSDEAIIKVAETIPESVLLNAINGNDRYESEPAIRKAVAEAIQEKYKDKPVVANVLMPKEELSLGELMGYAEDALRYKEEGIRQEVDYGEASNLINEKTDTGKYEKWLKELFGNIIEKEGIRNDKDLFTPSGNRRSFEALHYEHNLENVIKAMKEQGSIGIGGFGGNSILGSSVVEYGSISEIKEKANERMKSLPQEEYDKIRSGFTDRFFELANSMPIHKDSFSAMDDAANMLCEAVMKYKTKSGMANYLRNESKGWANYSDYIVDDLIALVNDIRNMPTGYFEAKPQRAVGFNEIATAIIPDNASEELKSKLTENNVQFIEYEAGNENARLEVLNSLEDVQFSLKGTNDTDTKSRKELLDIIEHLKGEFEVTKFAKADPKKLTKLTKDLLKEYNSKADFDETRSAIDELYTYMANGENGHTAVWEDVYSRAYTVAQKIVENSLVVDDFYYQQYKSLRDYLRGTPIKFNAIHDSVPSAYENFNDFRKSNMGRLKFTNDGMSIDYIYQELATLYPEFFDAEEQITSEDQFEQIINVLDQIKPMEINPFDSQIEQASIQLANDITSRFFDLPQAKATFADKAERRVVAERIKSGKKVEAVRQQKNERIKKLMESHKAKTKKQLDKLREQRNDKVKKEQQKRRDAISKMSEKQKVKVLRARIMRHTSELSKKLVNPTDNQHIPQELQGVVAKLLESINLESNYTYDAESGSYKKNDEGLPTKRTQAFNDLKKIYGEMSSSVVVDPDLLGENGWLSEVISLADKRIADMNSKELDTVWQAIRAIEASVSTANKIFSQGKFGTILEYAEALRGDNAGKKEKVEFRGVLGKGKKLATLDMLTPETYFHYLGSAGDSIFRMMRDAQDKHISIMKEVADFTHKALNGVDVNSLEKKVHTVKLGGEDVKLTTAQLMELYVLMRREQARDHILIGGILPDITEGKGLKLNTKAEPIRNLTIEEVAKALTNLTVEEKNIADKLQKFVSTVLSEYGNEASMKVYNYEKFLEKNYWTIRTNKQEIASEVGKDTSVTSVANKGMAKGTVPHANTSVRLGSIFDTFASHSSDMATYAAWLGTSEDVNRIRNFVFWEDGTRTGTVKGILDTVHGMHGSDYLQKLLTDAAIGVKGTDNMNPFDKLVGNYKAASVGANLRVVIQQPTAILRAADMIGAHYLAEGAVRPLKGWEKAKKYAPIAQWKDWGHFDINTGRQMKDVLFDNASLLERTKQVGMWGASMADSIAWGQLWNAVESETKAKHKELEVGSKEYYETVAKRFTEIVDHTQVVDGILQRSQIMRSPDALTKMATSFMGEPTKQYNMALSALYDAKNLKGDARKKAVGRLGRTALTLTVAGAVNACAQSIVDALRDDDKEKDYWEKWLAAFVGYGEGDKFIDSNLADTFNPLGYVPFAKDILSVMQGYDVKRMDTESITKTVNAITNMYKAITGTGKYTVAEASAQLFAEVARLYGLPVANVKRDVKSVATTAAIETNSYVLQYRMEKAMLNINYAGNSKNFMDILFNAYNNDREAYEVIYEDMLESGYSAEKIESGMESRMKEAEGVEKSSELTKRYMKPEDEKKYDSALTKVQSSDVWKSANATQRKEAEADLYNFITATSESWENTRAEAKAFGVDETEYTLWKLAEEIVDDKNNNNNSLDAKEKAKVIDMLNLGNSELAYFYGTKGSDEAYSHGINIENYAKFKAAVSGLKGDNKKSLVIDYANMYSDSEKEYLYFMGTEYSSYKKRNDYIRYFGK